MAITTYSELQSAIADFLNRDDLTSVIPNFIYLAEADIARKLRHWLQERKVRTSFDEGFEFLPDDWLETISLRNSDGTEIELVSMRDMARLKRSNSTGKPKYYRIEAGRIEIYPTPDTGYNVDLVYYGRIPALTDTNTTNWLLVNHPDILLYGSLLQSAPYLGEDARATTWGALYSAAIQALQADTDTARHSGPLRMRIK